MIGASRNTFYGCT